MIRTFACTSIFLFDAFSFLLLFIALLFLRFSFVSTLERSILLFCTHSQVPALIETPYPTSHQELQLANHIDDYFRSELILKRNKRMSQRVLELLERHPERSFFFAFGAGKAI